MAGDGQGGDSLANRNGGVLVDIVRPSADLQSFVTFFYFVETAQPITDFLYPEWGNVRFAITGRWVVKVPGFDDDQPQMAALFGPTDRHGEIQTCGGKTVGFGLTPIGWTRLIAGSAGTLANRVVPLGSRLGIEGEDLRAQLVADHDHRKMVGRLETLLRTLLASRPPVSAAVLAIDRALRTRPADMTSFAAAAGVSPRTLHRMCFQAFGFAPKRLMRLQRFLDTLGHVRTAVGENVRSSMSEAYYDQSHFYRDFREFMAMTPRQYFGAPRHLMAAAAEAQVRAGVTLSFRLPPPACEEERPSSLSRIDTGIKIHEP